MKFLLDESVDARVAVYLRSRGHDVTAIFEDRPSLPDHDVLSIASSEQRILVTNDRDFGELIFRHRQAHAGVIYLRLGTYQLTAIVARLSEMLQEHGGEVGQFIVVTPRRVRIRRS